MFIEEISHFCLNIYDSPISSIVKIAAVVREAFNKFWASPTSRFSRELKLRLLILHYGALLQPYDQFCVIAQLILALIAIHWLEVLRNDHYKSRCLDYDDHLWWSNWNTGASSSFSFVSMFWLKTSIPVWLANVRHHLPQWSDGLQNSSGAASPLKMTQDRDGQSKRVLQRRWQKWRRW